MKKMTLVAVVTIGLVAGIAAGVAMRINPETQELVLSSATLLSKPRLLPDFSLTTANATVINNETLKQQWTLVFFGFTNCPDICPTTLATLSRVIKLLGTPKNSLQPKILFVSVDPMRDTPEMIQDYVKFFNPSFEGATADTQTLQLLTRAMNVAYGYRPTENVDEYTVDHTSAVLLLNPEANLHALFTTPHKAGEMAADVRTMIDAYR